MKYRIPLSVAQIEVLLTISEMEPATITLLTTAQKFRHQSINDRVQVLLRRGLISRTKYKPEPLTKDEKLGFEPTRLRTGKRPYIYQLTPKGIAVAEGLELAARAFADPVPIRTHNGARVSA